jgi:hypothetical protein
LLNNRSRHVLEKIRHDIKQINVYIKKTKYKKFSETVLVKIPDDGPLRPKHVVLE